MCKNDVYTIIKIYFMIRNANHHLSLWENGADKPVNIGLPQTFNLI